MILKRVIFVFLILSSINLAQSKSKLIDDLLTRYHEYGLLQGSVLVAEKGEIIFKGGFGFANLDYEIPNTEKTVHRVGSITKQFTAAVIMQLVEEGKIKLDEKITTYLNDYRKDTGDKVTIHHLLTHTSGIPSYTNLPGFWSDSIRNPYTLEKLIKNFCSGNLEFEPGTQFAYNNSGYVILAKLIEDVTGKGYEENIQERIFDKIGMNNSYLERPEIIIKNRASGYEKLLSEFKNTNYMHVGNSIGAGDISSTVTDLYLWDKALYNNKILSEESKKKMFTSYKSNYGYGWSVIEVDSITIYSHGGGINGFSSFTTRVEDDSIFIVVLNNISRSSSLEISTNITKIMYGDEYDFPKKPISYHLLEIIEEEGIDEAIEIYKGIKVEEKDAFNFDEHELNELGYFLLANKDIEEAEKVFLLNIEEYPKSYNVYDSMGEAYMVKGEKQKAILNYRKSIELNPQNLDAYTMLQKLGVNVSPPKDVNVPIEILEEYVGKYELFPNFIIDITTENNKLYAKATDQTRFQIFAEKENMFYYKVVQAKIEFIRDDNNKINKIILYQNNNEMPGKRVEQ